MASLQDLDGFERANWGSAPNPGVFLNKKKLNAILLFKISPPEAFKGLRGKAAELGSFNCRKWFAA